ncbi:uncharacterized protein CLUP02_04871 [Colletotrichum lupini]|uniref:Uncharacterized protein n=1 Tax=Colletotrichum lupini TaxID=145971 RepID=A0A9Q8SL57_9PEZI|nr:uncharacterized protein CLUP02_04871 [Colletotrichum lupini]UQC79392.1 hypothetical protein CLUP02_04871 [Colletotrichum lupini]
MRFGAIVTTLALLAGFAAAAPAVPGNAVEPRQTRDGFYYGNANSFHDHAHRGMNLSEISQYTSRSKLILMSGVEGVINADRKVWISCSTQLPSTNGENNWRFQYTQ